jgi:hypothetical protein
MLTMTEPEDMELDYDDPVQSMNTPGFHSSFQSSQSFFSKDRLNPNFENSVTDLFGNIQLNEGKKQEERKGQNTNVIIEKEETYMNVFKQMFFFLTCSQLCLIRRHLHHLKYLLIIAHQPSSNPHTNNNNNNQMMTLLYSK